MLIECHSKFNSSLAIIIIIIIIIIITIMIIIIIYRALPADQRV